MKPREDDGLATGTNIAQFKQTGRTPLQRRKTFRCNCTINQAKQSSLASPRGRTRPYGALV